MTVVIVDQDAAAVARDALRAQLDTYATKAASDARYKPMAARAAQALGALERALELNGEQNEQ